MSVDAYMMARLDQIEANTRPQLGWIAAIAVALVLNLFAVPYIQNNNVPVLTESMEKLIVWENNMADQLGLFSPTAYAKYNPKMGKNKVMLARYVEQVGKNKGLPKYYMATTASIESSLNPKADRCKGRDMCVSARGTYQFILKTGRRFGLVRGGKDYRMNNELSTQKAAEYAAINKKTLIRNGIAVTGENLYLLHNQGDGAVQILRLAQGKQARIYPKMYSNILNNCGKYKRAIKRIGKPTPQVARLFLKHRKETWYKNYNYIKRKLS